MKGKFITFEGSEGSGKSTQMKMANKYLTQQGADVLFLREPGGVKISEKIRRILLDVDNDEMGKECEMLLYMAARAQLVEEVIVPALKKGKTILCDRFLDSTLVYQGYGHNMDIDFIKKIGHLATQGVAPDLTIVFDIAAEVGLSRINRAKDRIEQRKISYHNRVHAGYLDLAKKEPKRIKIIKVNKGKDEIHQVVRTHMDEVLGLNV